MDIVRCATPPNIEVIAMGIDLLETCEAGDQMRLKSLQKAAIAFPSDPVLHCALYLLVRSMPCECVENSVPI